MPRKQPSAHASRDIQGEKNAATGAARSTDRGGARASEQAAAPRGRSAAVSLDDVHVAYPNGTEALRGVSVRIDPGSYTCVIGGNGSGKSTFAQVLNALIAPTQGSVRVFGMDTADPVQQLTIRSRAAMVFQHPEDQMVTSVVADDVAFGPENLALPQPQIAARVDEALAAVALADLAQADPADLSGGQKQRVAIAGAFAMHPDLLILDEPAAMLDVRGRRGIRRVCRELNERGITIVHVTHFMDDVLDADRVLVLDGGLLVLDGTPEQVFSHEQAIRTLNLDLPASLSLAEKLDARGLPVPHLPHEDDLARAVAQAATDRAKNARAQPGQPSAVSAGTTAASTAPCAEQDEKNPATGAAAASVPYGTGASAPTAAPSRTADGDAPAALSFSHVSFSYAAPKPERRKRRLFARKHGNGALPADAPWALEDVSLTVEPGSLTALIGHTGAGKSTVIELACALKQPAAGQVRVAGIDVADAERRRELRRAVGYVSQLPERQLFAETVYDDIAFGPRNLGLAEDEVRAGVSRACELVGLDLDALGGRSPFALSGGQQRCVALAGVLALGPRILVLDEPMAGLDPAGRARTLKLLRALNAQGTAMLVVTHSMDDVAAIADQVVVMDHGRVALSGTPAEVFAREEDLHRIGLGTPSAQRLARKIQAAGLDLPEKRPLTLDALADEVLAAASPERPGQGGAEDGASC